MQSHNGAIDTTHTPPPLSFYNTFKAARQLFHRDEITGLAGLAG
jgi:hypothetical protein